MFNTFTPEMAQKLESYLASHELPNGLGTAERACSVAAINLAISGKLTDKIPDCMSRVVGRWIISVQDAMPHEMRNSTEWKSLLPLAAGTGRSLEKERAKVALDWMWDVVLPVLQPMADAGGYGYAWGAMCVEKTPAAANAANAAARAVYAACTAYATARAANAANAAAAYAAFWQSVNPCAVLRAMIEVTA